MSPKRWLLDLFAGSRMRFDLLRFNFGPLMVVVALYTFLSSALVIPLFSRAMQAVMDTSGLESLTVDNVPTFLTNPLTLLSTLALFIFLAFYMMLDLGSAIYTFDCARQRKHVSIRSILFFSLKNAARMFLPQNLPIILVCLVMVPFVGLAMSSGIVSAISVPTTLLVYIRSNLAFLAGSLILMVACFVLSLKWMYVLHFYTIEGVDFPQAVRRSARLKRSQRVQNLVSMLVIQGILALANRVVTVVGQFGIVLVLDTVGAKSMVGALLASAVLVVFITASGILTLMGNPVGALKISGKFYQLTEAAGEKIDGIACGEAVVSRRAKRVGGALGIATLVTLTVLIALYANLVATGQRDNLMIGTDRPEVISFEGGGASATQDSLASLRATAKMGADGAVVDVQISKDGVAFLAMSPDMAVSCGVQGNSWELDYEEIHANSVRVRGSEEKAAPRLSDAIQRASDEGISLVLDISSLSSRDEAIEAAVDDVRSADALDWCEFASGSYDDLVLVRSLEPEAKTVLIASVSGSEYDTLEAADAIAFEGALVSKDNIAAVHESGHKAYAWNVSGESKLDSAIRAKADALVTMNVSAAINEVSRSGLSAMGYAFFSRL